MRPAAICRQLWQSRWLFLQWVQRDFIVRYRQSILGVAWAVIQPALLLVVYGLVFTKVLHIRSPRGSYLVFAYCGLAPWTFLSNAVTWGIQSLITNSSVIKQVYFPRSVIPLAAGGVVVLDLLVGTGVLLILQLVTAHAVHLSTFALFPIYIGLLLLVEGVVVFAGIFAAFVRDIRFVVPLLLQIIFIATPIMYPQSQAQGSIAKLVFSSNPLARVIAASRQAVIYGRWPSLGLMGGLIGAGFVVLSVSLVYSHAIEDRLPDLL
jgi:ABC-type polysaccharide/polyol phosphate export permease